MGLIQTSIERQSPNNNAQPLTLAKQRRSVELLNRLDDLSAQRLFFEIYPDVDSVWEGPTILGGLMVPGQTLYARDRYPRHMECLAAGKDYRERCAMFGNRTGKTLGVGCYELSCHLTGLYPHWWQGRVFEFPISAWTAGKSYETTRDILQLTLLGEITFRGGHKAMDGRGIIPGYLLGRNTWRSGIQDVVDRVIVKHVTGGHSFLGFKSYDQGRKSFEGTGRHIILFDEEPPMDVYNEALIRTATLNGITMLTFTPLSGLSEVVLSFLPADQRPDITD